MFDSTITWIIIIIIAGLCYYSKKSNQNTSNPNKNISSNQLILPAKKQSMNIESPDEFLTDIEVHVNNTTNEIQIAVEQYKSALKEKYAQDLIVKQELSKFARDHKLDNALIAVWDELKNYPNWAKRDDFQEFNKINIINCTGFEEKKDNKIIKYIYFYWDEKKYQITYIEEKLYVPDGGTHASFLLSETEEEVFGVNTSLRHEEFGSNYHCFDIIIFKRKGEWYKFLLDAWKIIEIEKEKMRANLHYYNADKIKDNFQK